jgi:hypothetical protein
MDKWARAIQAAESVLEENLSQVNRITIWLVGGTDGVATHIHANIVDADGETTKSRYEIPEWLIEELDTEKAMMGHAVEAIATHLLLTKYQEKFD